MAEPRPVPRRGARRNQVDPVSGTEAAPHDCALCRALLFAIAEAERLRAERRGTLRIVEGSMTGRTQAGPDVREMGRRPRLAMAGASGLAGRTDDPRTEGADRRGACTVTRRCYHAPR